MNIEFCLSILKGQYYLDIWKIHHAKKWKLYKSLTENCGWIFPFQEVCLIAPRPTKFSLHEDGMIHLER
ncbi:MAG: hypothetical protein AAFR37_17660, partial [Cyanobacteria bacterium J06628_3]